MVDSYNCFLQMCCIAICKEQEMGVSLICMILAVVTASVSGFRIAQGVKANFEDWKFVVNLRIWLEPTATDPETQYSSCTGSLIGYHDVTFILTAGHCFQCFSKKRDPNYIVNEPVLKQLNGETVLFQGVIDVIYPITESTVGVIQINATFEQQTALIPLEKFGMGKEPNELDVTGITYGPMDFAIVKVDKNFFGYDKVEFFSDFQPIGTDEFFEKDCQFAGWGKIGTDRELYDKTAGYPTSLQVANLVALDTSVEANRQRCQNSTERHRNPADLPFCLVWNQKIHEKPRLAAGDSGGPSFCAVKGKRKFAGVISSRELGKDMSCLPDGTDIQFEEYNDMLVIVAPVNRILNFIAQHY